MMARWRCRRPVRRWMKIRVRSWEGGVGVGEVAFGFGGWEGDGGLVVLSFSWALFERVWVERAEGWVGGRFVRSCMVTLGERSSVCSWGVWFSLVFLAGSSWSSRPVLFKSSGCDALWSGDSVGK